MYILHVSGILARIQYIDSYLIEYFLYDLYDYYMK